MILPWKNIDVAVIENVMITLSMTQKYNDIVKVERKGETFNEVFYLDERDGSTHTQVTGLLKLREAKSSSAAYVDSLHDKLMRLRARELIISREIKRFELRIARAEHFKTGTFETRAATSYAEVSHGHKTRYTDEVKRYEHIMRSQKQD